MKQETGYIDWLLGNWNYIVAAIIFCAMISYGRKLNEIVYLVTFAPSRIYFLILHPLMRTDAENENEKS